MKTNAARILTESFLLLGIGIGPVLLLFAILAFVTPLMQQVTLEQAILFPVIGLLAIVTVIASILHAPAHLSRFWFLLLVFVHLYYGVAAISSESVQAVGLGLLCLAYSFWELRVVIGSITQPLPAPKTPS